MTRNISLLGVPADTGSRQSGCLMGPDALRTAGITSTLSELGHNVTDIGNLSVLTTDIAEHANKSIHHLSEYIGMTEVINQYCEHDLPDDVMPIFMGGDHSVAAGILPSMAKRAKHADRPFYLLWLDAHPDIHTLHTTSSGNLHGTPIAYSLGDAGFESNMPTNDTPLKEANICMLGIRSVDPEERIRLANSKIDIFDMRAIDEHGIAAPLRKFLQRVADANGHLHVSFDVDFLDPDIAPAVGTTVPGGASFREAHLIMELLHDSDLVTSLDIVELNPFLDERGKTAKLMVDLTASLLGRRVLDRPTRSF